jgi:hypothetical protein
LDGENKFEERMLQEADHYKVEKLCLSALGKRWPRTPSHEQCVEANDCTAETVRRYPGRLLGFCYVNPQHSEEAVAEIERCIGGLGFVGVKLWVACHADEPCVFPVVEKAIELRVPVLQHTWYKRGGRENEPGESTCEHYAALARRYPEAKLIAGHVGGDWERGIKVVKPCGNIVADVCGSDNYSGFVEMAVRELGADRVVFGTDMPGRSMASQIGKVLGADISDADKEKILGRNVQRLLERK